MSNNSPKIKALLISLLVLAFSANLVFVSTSQIQAKEIHHDFEFKYDNPIEQYSFTAWLKNILSQVYDLVAWLTVIMIVIGGIFYMISVGNSTQMELAKKTITAALIGFAIIVAAPTFLKEIMELTKVNQVSESPEIIENAEGIKPILENILTFILTAVGVLGIISFAISGIMYLTSGGNQTRAGNAQKAMLYSIVGITITGASLIVVQQIMKFLAN